MPGHPTRSNVRTQGEEGGEQREMGRFVDRIPQGATRKEALFMRRTIVLLSTMALTLLVASGVVLAATIGSAGADSSVVGPGESIQKAVNAADPGDTIVVRGV